MIVRKINMVTDYETIKKWWTKRGLEFVTKYHLPKSGYIVDNTCAVFLYKTDSKLQWLSWFVSNPGQVSKIILKGMNIMVQEAQKDAKETGNILCASTPVDSLINLMVSNEFIVGDTGATHVTWGG